MRTDRERLGRERAFYTRLVNGSARKRDKAMATARERKAHIDVFGVFLVRSAVHIARMHNSQMRHWLAEREQFDRDAVSGTMDGYRRVLLSRQSHS